MTERYDSIRTPSRSFVLAMPDVFLRGLVSELIESLEGGSFRITTAHPLQLSTKQMRRVYEDLTFDPTRWNAQRIEECWGSLNSFYREAPALVFFVERDEADAFAELKALKGHSRPEVAKSGSIRGRLAESVMLNLLHSPDDWAALIREGEILLGRRVLEAHLRAFGDGRLRRLLDARTALNLLPASGSETALSFPLVGTRIRRRILRSIACMAAADPDRAVAQMLDLDRILEAQMAAMLDAATAPERMTIAIQTSTVLGDQISVAARRVSPRLAALEEQLASLHDVARSPLPGRAITSAGEDVYVSRLEAQVIELHDYSFGASETLKSYYPRPVEA